jgi:hypothetical protein
MAKGWLDNYGVKENENNSSVSLPEGFVGMGNNNKGRNYSPAWGGSFQMGGSIPGAVGFSYARVGAPSKGPRRNQTDVTDASAQNGKEMKYYQEGLDFKPKTISQNGGKKFKLKDEREENLIKRDEIPNIKPIKIGKPLTAKQKEERRVQELINKQGTITASKPQSIASKAWEIATHPMTALGYAVRNESLPENFSRGPINAHEMAVDIINPAFYTDQGIKAIQNTGSAINNVSEGKLPAAYRDIKNAGMNALSVVPVVGEFGPEINQFINSQRALPIIGDYKVPTIAESIGKYKPYVAEAEQGLEPYISKIGEPSISREEEVFRNVMGTQYREAKELQNTKFLDSEGNLISNPNTSQQQFYQGDIPATDRPIQKDGGVIKDDMGYWNPDNWGKDVEIDQSDPNSFIDMEGVYEPLLGVSDKGEERIMYPGEKHKFKKGTKKVIESRIAQNGLRQEQKGLENLDQLTNFTNYNKPQPGGWLNKYN